MEDVASYLRFDQTGYAMKSARGPAIHFMVLGNVFQRAEKKWSHGSCVISLLAKIESGEMRPTALLVAKADVQKSRPVY